MLRIGLGDSPAFDCRTGLLDRRAGLLDDHLMGLPGGLIGLLACVIGLLGICEGLGEPTLLPPPRLVTVRSSPENSLPAPRTGPERPLLSFPELADMGEPIRSAAAAAKTTTTLVGLSAGHVRPSMSVSRNLCELARVRPHHRHHIISRTGGSVPNRRNAGHATPYRCGGGRGGEGNRC